MKNELFSDEFLREMNHKASLLRAIERLKLTDPGKYITLKNKYGVDSRQFNILPVKMLQEVIEEITNEYNTQ